MKDLGEISSIFNYKFKSLDTLKEALTHPNAEVVHQMANKAVNYERLEFLGDSILDLIIADILYKLYPQYNDGDLTKRKIGLTCGKTLVLIAKQINLSSFVIINELKSVCNDSCLENVLEAVIGAIYIDGGYQSAKNFVYEHWKELVMCDSIFIEEKNTKSLVETWAKRNEYPTPKYKLIRHKGPIHKRCFTVSLNIKSLKTITAEGSSIKEAEKKAAQLYLDYIKHEVPDRLQKSKIIENENPENILPEFDTNNNAKDESYQEKQGKKMILSESNEISTQPKTPHVEDPKTLLQNLFLTKKLPLPKYILVNQLGPEHDTKFTVKVGDESIGYVWTSASSKKKAEKNAAELLLNSIRNMENSHKLHTKTIFESEFKTKLFHWTQKNKYSLPTYKLIKEIGPKHNVRFVVEASINDVASAFGAASSKKGAEQEAAKVIFNTIMKE